MSQDTSQDTSELSIELDTNQTLDTMLLQVLNSALVTIGAEAGSLMLVANKRGILQIKARLGKPRQGRKREQVYKIADNSVASWVVQNRRPYLCPDVDTDPFFAPSRSGRNFLSLLSVPVVYQNEVIAVINADAPEKGYFKEKHIAKLESVARQVAAPIAERISILDALAEVGVELSRLPSEEGVGPVLEKIAQLAVRSLGADLVTLYQYIQEKDEFPVEGTGPTIDPEVRDPTPMRRKMYPGDVPLTVVKERKPGFYSDVEKEDFLTRVVERPGEMSRPRFVEREGIKSMAALLLPFSAAESKDEEVVGAMFVNYRTHHEFNIDEISALATFADYAAVAILNARHEQQRRVEQQMRIAESISATIAHRMSNLAGTSRVATQLLREQIAPENELARRQLDRIEAESKLLHDLAETIAHRFKEIGRLSDLIPVDVSKVIDEELEQVKPDLRGIAISKDLAPGLPKVLSVEFQLRQVFHDIIRNAIEAMGDQESGKLLIRVRIDRRKNRVRVEISDTGPGIREEIRRRMFSAGTTTKQDRLGFGLWSCRTFMQATGGDVDFLKDTPPGEGATFVVEIPCVTGESTALDELPAKDILIVDDDLEWREQLIDVMASEQYSVEKASNYATASHALQIHHFKLAIIDIDLEGGDSGNRDGLRLLMDIDKDNLDTNVIIVTGTGIEEGEVTAHQSRRLRGFIDKKEFDLHHFRALARQALQG